ncbi:MAG: hemolysin secretion protein [Cypionkella sp.]|uniref:HlyD family secretion protein n=1 Tax=Cypionkella sp. TaxID=2811411 RepID=UPI00261A7B28|nr:HlyD family secretion protein [Cypionkella sp.]MDB5657855.1 hemolysin secretion protein [Cypionkella sp.]
MRFPQFFTSKATILVLLAGVIGVLAILYAWQLPPFTSTVQSTDNAYVKGRVTLIAPQLAGYVASVPVTDYQNVKQGDLLVQMDDRTYQQQLAQAQASLAQQENNLENFESNRRAKQASIELAQAQLSAALAALDKTQADFDRNVSLTNKGLSAESVGEQSRAALVQAQSAVAEAQASVNIAQLNLISFEGTRNGFVAAVDGAKAAAQLARINLQNTKIVAPLDGQLGEVSARLGQFVSAGTQLTSITPPQTWIVANFKETQLGLMQIGQSASLTVDALSKSKLTGHITQISPATGSEFSVLKPDNATGNFTKIAQRIPVHIELDPGQDLAKRLAPGMSVSVAVDTADAAANNNAATTR